jgi:hypothetical protein
LFPLINVREAFNQIKLDKPVYFKEICTKTAGDYEQLLVRTSKDKKWATELNILAMTIILDRPIALWSHYEKRNILPFNTLSLILSHLQPSNSTVKITLI